mmetsp:Transcript_36706/g.49136  ORF Transcript_36706/g.49136 Transcript_36706/m.49136 type:complete len:82 (-) Transcript_36706:1282-1527(-)
MVALILPSRHETIRSAIFLQVFWDICQLDLYARRGNAFFGGSSRLDSTHLPLYKNGIERKRVIQKHINIANSKRMFEARTN